MSTEKKVHYSVDSLTRPNLAAGKGNNVSDDRSHVKSGPQTASNFNKPASGAVRATKAKA